MLARDEIVERKGLRTRPARRRSPRILRDEGRQLRTLLAEVPAAKLKRVLAEVPDGLP